MTLLGSALDAELSGRHDLAPFLCMGSLAVSIFFALFSIAHQYFTLSFVHAKVCTLRGFWDTRSECKCYIS